MHTNRLALACIGITLSLLGCEENRSTKQPVLVKKPTLTRADDQMKLLDLPEGSQLCFGRSIVVPQQLAATKTNISLKSTSQPGETEITIKRRPIVIVGGHFYQRAASDDSVYLDLLTGERLSEGEITKLKESHKLYALWSPLSNRSLANDAPDAPYLELTGSQTLPVYPVMHNGRVCLSHGSIRVYLLSDGSILFQSDGKPVGNPEHLGSLNCLTLHPGTDPPAQAAGLTVGDLRRVLGEESYVLMPSSQKH